MEYRECITNRGDLDHFSNPRVCEDQHPGNENIYYRTRQDVLPQRLVPAGRESDPSLGWEITDTLWHHDRRQEEARKRVDYLARKSSTPPPFSSPKWVLAKRTNKAREEKANEACEETSTALPTPPPATDQLTSAFAADTPTSASGTIPKRKPILLEEYREQQKRHSPTPNVDEHGDPLDYCYDLSQDKPMVQESYNHSQPPLKIPPFDINKLFSLPGGDAPVENQPGKENTLLDTDLHNFLMGLQEIDDTKLDLLATSILKIRKAHSPCPPPGYPELPPGLSPARNFPVSAAIQTTTSNLGCMITSAPISSAVADKVQRAVKTLVNIMGPWEDL